MVAARLASSMLRGGDVRASLMASAQVASPMLCKGGVIVRRESLMAAAWMGGMIVKASLTASTQLASSMLGGAMCPCGVQAGRQHLNSLLRSAEGT